MVARFLCVAFVAVAIVIQWTGCNYEHFTALDSSKKLAPFECHMFTAYGTVVWDDDSIIVKAGGGFTARKLYRTITESECWVRVLNGDALRIRLRTTDHLDSAHSGVSLTLGKTQSTMYEPGRPMLALPCKLDNNYTHVTMFSDATVMKIVVGCDTVFSGRPLLPATDMLAFESVDGSEAVVRGLSSRNLREDAKTIVRTK